MAAEPDRDWEHFKLLVEEYRFQVDLNWRRSQYFFVLNVGLLVAAVGLLSAARSAPDGMIAAVFAAGALMAALSLVANRVQHGYYRSARDAMRCAQRRLELDPPLATTPGMGSRLERPGRVRSFLAIMLVTLACTDLAGAIVAVAR